SQYLLVSHMPWLSICRILICLPLFFFFLSFFFNDTATTEIYTLSLHDALPICLLGNIFGRLELLPGLEARISVGADYADRSRHRSEEHTSELQSRRDLVCRLLLEKKKTDKNIPRARTRLRQYS